MAITKWPISGSEKTTRNEKRLRHVAIAFSYAIMLQRTLPAGFIAPCLPTRTDTLPPSGSQWLHEIKDDGPGLDTTRY
jgi:hypothetical protein